MKHEHSLRKSTIKLLSDTLDPNVSEKVEKGIYCHAIEEANKRYVEPKWSSIQFKNIYRNLGRHVIMNVKRTSHVDNKNLSQRISEGKCSAKGLSKMENYDMFPDAWKVLKDKQLKQLKQMYEINKEGLTTQFKCRRCGKRECTYFELQTRSADEPMTTFITCVNCNYHWKE